MRLPVAQAAACHGPEVHSGASSASARLHSDPLMDVFEYLLPWTRLGAAPLLKPGCKNQVTTSWEGQRASSRFLQVSDFGCCAPSSYTLLHLPPSHFPAVTIKTRQRRKWPSAPAKRTRETGTQKTEEEGGGALNHIWAEFPSELSVCGCRSSSRLPTKPAATPRFHWGSYSSDWLAGLRERSKLHRERSKQDPQLDSLTGSTVTSLLQQHQRNSWRSHDVQLWAAIGLVFSPSQLIS